MREQTYRTIVEDLRAAREAAEGGPAQEPA
jgi:hypothetical protein